MRVGRQRRILVGGVVLGNSLQKTKLTVPVPSLVQRLDPVRRRVHSESLKPSHRSLSSFLAPTNAIVVQLRTHPDNLSILRRRLVQRGQETALLRS